MNTANEQTNKDFFPSSEENQTSSIPEQISPDNPIWSSPGAFGIWIWSIFALVILVNVSVLIYAFASDIKLAEIGNAIKEQSNSSLLLVSVLSTFPAHLLTILAVWLIVTRAGKLPFWKSLGWNWGKRFGFWSSLGVALGFYLIAGLIISLFGETDNDLLKMLRSSRTAVLVTAFLATFTAPFVEESVYRGVMYPAFRKSFGAPIAITLVTLFFAVVHVPQYYPSYGVILAILLLSLVLTSVRATTGNLLPCVVIHTIFNGIQSILLVAEPYLPKTSAPTESITSYIFPYFFK